MILTSQRSKIKKGLLSESCFYMQSKMTHIPPFISLIISVRAYPSKPVHLTDKTTGNVQIIWERTHSSKQIIQSLKL